MKSRDHRCHQYPFDKKLKKKKKFKKGFKLEDPILGRELTQSTIADAEKDSNANQKLNFKSEVQMDSLCRGQQLRVRNIMYHTLIVF